VSGLPLIDVLALTSSLFNTLLLFWLGLTVLFNAESRSWGVLLAASGLLVGAVFFLGHSVLLIQGAGSLIDTFGFWWNAGWLPLIAAPLSWYLLMLWYGGYWDARDSALRRRQSIWLYLALVFTFVLFVLTLLVNPLSGLSQVTYAEAGRVIITGSIPPILLLYPLFILLCTGLSLDALLRPAPSRRPMGELARKRARPALVGASGALLLISLMVGVFFAFLVLPILPASARALIPELDQDSISILAAFDLILALLISLVVLLVGQAIVSYEIFTGRTLPRRGFIRQWRLTVGLAAGLSLLTALGVSSHLNGIYILLVILLLVIASYAVFGWQIYNERVVNIRQLRPLSVNQHLFESILSPPPGSMADLNLGEPFRALCEEILEARMAFLQPMGALAALGVPPLAYPDRIEVPQSVVQNLADLFSKQQPDPETAVGRPLDPAVNGGFIWATPLWNERGLGGILLFGEKLGGAIYSMEEIELARTSGERLIDLLASAELARRLIALQRQRMVESGLQDQYARRVLHDDVLPQLHTAILQLGSQNQQDVAGLLSEAHKEVSDLLRELPSPVSPDVAEQGLAAALRRVVDLELRGSFERVDWQVDPQAENQASGLPPLVAEVFYFAAREALRNASRHARPQGDSAGLEVAIRMDWVDGLLVRIEDNGVGIQPGSMDGGSGGQGLSLHGAMMAVINGSLSVESAPGEFTRVILELPESALESWGG
jgi:signal transduction histidine kinase